MGTLRSGWGGTHSIDFESINSGRTAWTWKLLGASSGGQWARSGLGAWGLLQSAKGLGLARIGPCLPLRASLGMGGLLGVLGLLLGYLVSTMAALGLGCWPGSVPNGWGRLAYIWASRF